MSVWEHLFGMRPLPPRGDAVRAAVSARLVVVTGASRGIGAECARRFARAGARVILLARGEEALAEVAAGIRDSGGEAWALPVDLRDEEAVEHAARRILDEHGVPAVIVSNAGHSIHRPLSEYAERGHDVTRTLGVNYLGPVTLLRVLLPAMQRAGGGSVVSVSSVITAMPAPGWSVYGASKTAMDAWLLAVAPEVAPEVSVSIVRLPLVRTRMSGATPAYREAPAMRPVDAAALVARAVVTGRRVIGPWWLRPVAALLALAPTALDRVLLLHERRIER